MWGRGQKKHSLSPNSRIHKMKVILLSIYGIIIIYSCMDSRKIVFRTSQNTNNESHSLRETKAKNTHLVFLCATKQNSLRLTNDIGDCHRKYLILTQLAISFQRIESDDHDRFSRIVLKRLCLRGNFDLLNIIRLLDISAIYHCFLTCPAPLLWRNLCWKFSVVFSDKYILLCLCLSALFSLWLKYIIMEMKLPYVVEAQEPPLDLSCNLQKALGPVSGTS